MIDPTPRASLREELRRRAAFEEAETARRVLIMLQPGETTRGEIAAIAAEHGVHMLPGDTLTVTRTIHLDAEGTTRTESVTYTMP